MQKEELKNEAVAPETEPAETAPVEETKPLWIELKNGKRFHVVEVEGISGTDIFSLPVPAGDGNVRVVQDVALELANQFASQRTPEGHTAPVLDKLGASYQMPLSEWFTSQGYIKFGYKLDGVGVFETDVRLQLTAVEYREPQVTEKVVEKIVEKVVEKPVEKPAETFKEHGLLTADQAKTLKGKALPPFLNGTHIIHELAFMDTFVSPVTKIEFTIVTDDDMQLTVAEKTLLGANTHTPEFLDTIRDAFVDVATKYTKLLPKYDFGSLTAVTDFNPSTGVYSVTLK